MDLRHAILYADRPSLSPDQKLATDTRMAMQLIRSDVMRGLVELPPWLTAHMDTCECGNEKTWFWKAFDSDVWIQKHSCEAGQGWHGCLNCSQPY